MSTNHLDMSPVMVLLKDAYHTAQTLDQKEWDDSSTSNAQKAELSRTINHLADQLFLASGMVRNEYWIGKGFNDAIVTVTDGEEE